MRFLPESGRPTVAVIGFGYVGSCIAATLADRGLDVVAVDADARLVDELAHGRFRLEEPGLAEKVFAGLASGRLRVTADMAAAAAADVILITVGTPVRDDGSLAGGQLRGACLALAGHLRAGQLVVLKSTVPPGTTRETVLPLLESGGLTGGTDFGLAFTPERLAEGTALRELLTFPIVAGGYEQDSVRAVTAFWRRTLGVEVIPCDSLEAAEIVKLASNWWIDVNIAVANELAKFCALYGVDVLDVTAAANTIQKGTGSINILRPGVGVGGSCLTKDPWMVWNTARRLGVDIRTASTGREVNAGMPQYTAGLVTDELGARGKDPAHATVAVLGLAFKNDTGDLRATPVLDTVRALTRAGVTVRLHDPLVDAQEAEAMFGTALCATVEEAVLGADCVAVLAPHRDFAGIDYAALPVAENCVLLDGRAYFPKERIAEFTAAGYVYRGVGRGPAVGGAPGEVLTRTAEAVR
ncbi:nucleotide sugar dehydrogenase [Streptomyces sp. NBC_01754]|uniref:nucleotide sugar dehydrogenase n=1 Tax=Streptomyces sp. NBC_01754 TaxID=2975930 RepID=UPI002DDA3D05|nr:nucleotide sugar dehydrogenase [Streptomyces sp. NBC_01754]WSC90920.1 nucleotide sugar dehydrogenase [Streptomyces sp. NBC_01754]WSC96586.1 nucleotide sugar dehydrogenase [Streptomyces sp. NBC_01754]